MYKLRSNIAALLIASMFSPEIASSASNFDNAEIRVIRPRYFNKAGRFELGAALTTVMNETFIYTFLATGIASFHLSESWAIQGNFSYGTSIAKEDKRILFDEFEIKTQIFRTEFNTELVAQYTPIYGKWQLSSGRLIYFDTYLQAGGGLTGINWQYNDFCNEPDLDQNPDANPLPANQTKSYPGISLGAGQRYFVSKKQAYNIDFRFHRFFYNTLDAECDPIRVEQEGGFSDSATHDTLTLQFGTSYYF